MFAMRSGEKITWWPAGLEYALIRQDILSNTLNLLEYELTNQQRMAIDEALEEFKDEV